MAIVVENFSNSNKVPGFYGQTQYGAGAINLRSLPLTLLCVGLKNASSGSATVDVDILEITSKDDADTYFGVGGELSEMLYAAIDSASGYRLMGAAPSPHGSAVAATATITLANSATSAGYTRYYIEGVLIETLHASGDTISTMATAISAKINATLRLPVTASPSGGVVTLTVRSAGVRGNQYIIYQDKTNLPGAVTSTLAGGSAVTSSSLINGIFFSGGSGVETMTTLLAALHPGRYHRIVPAQNDATSLAAWETQLEDKAGALQGRMEHAIVGSNGSLVATTSLAQTTLNHPRFQMLWQLEGEAHPSKMAAAFAAKRAATEAINPNSAYDGYEFHSSIPPCRFPSQRPSATTQQSALDNSVTPITANDNGKAVCVRAITTKSLNGSTPDYRTIDVGMAVAPDTVRDTLRLFWETDFVVANPDVNDDDPTGKPRPAGVATPKLWNAAVVSLLKTLETERVITNVDQNLPQSEWNSVAGRIMSVVPCVPTPKQHQIGVLVKQLNAA